MADPIDLDDVAAGSGGFKIVGQNAYDRAGYSVASAGDVNGDGYADIIVGALWNVDTQIGATRGAAYVVFGKAGGFATPLDLDTIAAGSGGFKIQGGDVAYFAGRSVSSAGDINNDGLDDLIIGSTDLNPGQASVVFGKASGTPVDLDDVAAGSGGFVLQGESSGDRAGSTVSSAGDVNGDGIDDLIFGAPGNNSGGIDAGAAYVVFGRDVAADGGFDGIDIATIVAGTGGFKIQGQTAIADAGISVSAAGDVNGDGFDDLIVGADHDNGGLSYAGAAYVIFGKAGGFGALVDLDTIAAGTGGFKVQGQTAYDRAGTSVSSAGDVNGDGFDDVVIGAWSNAAGGVGAGAAYVLFGKASGFPAIVDLDNVAAGSGGFKLVAEDEFDNTGISVSAAGDVNGDGFGDVIVGSRADVAYVVFGKAGGFAAVVDLDDVAAGTGGFKIEGENAGDRAGSSVSSAGDLNGDGFDDLVVGAPFNGWDQARGVYDGPGAAYVVYGFATGPTARDDSFTAAEDGPAVAGNVVTNTSPDGADSDPQNDALTVIGVGVAGGHVGSPVAGSNGGLFTIAANGALTFDPAGHFEALGAGETATSSVAYSITERDGGVDTATVRVTVNGANDAPDAADDTLTAVDKGFGTRTIAVGTLLANDGDVDGDTLTITGVSGAVGGSVDISGGSVVFTAPADFKGTASFTYTVIDGSGGSDTATVRFSVLDEIFTTGNDRRDLNAYDLSAYTNAQATKALAGHDVVQLSQTQKLGADFFANGGNDTVTGSSATDRIHGDAGNDRLLGENGNDSLWGDAGDDGLSGGNGHDLLHAGSGFDTLTGGAGNDRFVFADAGTAASPEREAVTDFAFGALAGNKDAIDLSAFDLVDWSGSDSQITVAGGGSSRTIYVDLDNDHNAANNTTQAEIVIQVNAGLGGLVRNFIVSDTNPLADILL